MANTHVHESAIHHYVTLDVGDKNRLNQRVSHDSPETRKENAEHVAAFTGNSKTIVYGTSFILPRVVFVFG